MDLQNELSHLQSVTDITGKIARNSAAKKSKSKAPAPPIELSLDALLLQMYDLRQKLDVDGEPGNVTDDDFKSLAKAIEERRKDIDERQKEVYASLTRMGKLLDKVMGVTRITAVAYYLLEIHYAIARYWPPVHVRDRYGSA